MNKTKNILRVIVVLAMGLTPVVWFIGKWGYLINGIDTNFPLDPSSWFYRRFFVWNDLSNAGSDFSSSTAGLFFHFIQFLPFILGLSLHWVELLSFVFWFSAIVISSYLLSKVLFPERFLVQLLFVSLYSFNIYLFNSWENVKVANLALMAALPLGLVALNRKKEGSVIGFFVFTLLSGLFISGAGINPAYFVCYFLIILFYFFGEVLDLNPSQVLKRLKDYLFLAVLILLINSFWIFPTIDYIYTQVGGENSIQEIGFNNWVNSLSENTSIMNVLRMQGAWDWYAADSISGQPLYIPYSVNYFNKVPFLLFSFAVPFIAFLAYLFIKKRDRSLALAFGLMMGIGVFFGTGSHEPTGSIFNFLSKNIPFFSLFRSPWYIFTPMLVLSLSGLTSMFFYRLLSYNSRLSVYREIVNLFVLVIVIGNLVYCYPLVTGKIFRPDKEDGFYVKFPEYVIKSKEFLKTHNQGRIIGYPDDEIEQFQWGYRGIESILNLLNSNETFYAPLNNSASFISKIIKRFYESVRKNQLDASLKYAEKLKISYLFEKKDQRSLSNALADPFKSTPAASFDKWTFYRLGSNHQKIYLASSLVKVLPKESLDLAIPLIESNQILVEDDPVVKKINADIGNSGHIVFAENGSVKDLYNLLYTPSKLSNRIKDRDPSKVTYEFEIADSGFYQPILENYKLIESGINPDLGVLGVLDGANIKLEKSNLTDSFVHFKPIKLDGGRHKLVFDLAAKNLVAEDGLDNFDFKNSGTEDFKVEGVGQERFLSILNKGEKDISADLNVSPFDPLSYYLIKLKYKQVYGNNALLLVAQTYGKILFKSSVERLPNYPEWNTFSFYYEPVKAHSELKLALSAPFTKDPMGTKVFYNNVAVYRVFSNQLLFANEGDKSMIKTGTVKYVKKSPVEYEGEVEGEVGSQILVFSENFSPQWELSAVSSNGNKSRIKNLHFRSDSFSNGWYLEHAPEKYKFKIFYKRQYLFWIGGVLSTVAILFIFLRIFLGMGEKRLWRRIIKR